MTLEESLSKYCLDPRCLTTWCRPANDLGSVRKFIERIILKNISNDDGKDGQVVAEWMYRNSRQIVRHDPERENALRTRHAIARKIRRYRAHHESFFRPRVRHCWGRRAQSSLGQLFRRSPAVKRLPSDRGATSI